MQKINLTKFYPNDDTDLTMLEATYDKAKLLLHFKITE